MISGGTALRDRRLGRIRAFPASTSPSLAACRRTTENLPPRAESWPRGASFDQYAGATHRPLPFRGAPVDASVPAGRLRSVPDRPQRALRRARRGGAVRRADRQPDRLRELEAGQSRERVGHQRRRAAARSRASPPTSASIAARPSTSRSTPPRPPTGSTSTGWATTAATARGRSRRSQPDGVAAADSAGLPQPTRPPGWSTAATGPCRRPGRCPPTRSRASTSPSWCATTAPRARATSSSSCATTTAHSDLLFQTSDTTWQAYNDYGGNSLYAGGPPAGPRLQGQLQPAVHDPRRRGPRTASFNAEYPMVRWLERNGYDVSYITGVDTDRRGAELLEHKVFLSVGHDEYWSGQQRANVEAARDAGVNLAFFSGNEIFWKTRWENSIDGSGHRYRTLVCYKETHANAKIDPDPPTLDRHLARPALQPAGRRRPARERADRHDLHGQRRAATAIEVPAADGKMRFWRNTSVATLARRRRPRRSADGTLGYEWDEDLDNGFRPPGLIRLSVDDRSTRAECCRTTARNYGPGTATHHLTLYRAASGALVFGAGTVQWSWGLDGEPRPRRSTPRTRGCSRRRSTCSPTWACSRRPCRPACVRRPRRPTRRRRPRRSPRPRTARSVPSGNPVTITGTADRRRRRAWSAASRSRSTAAPPGTRPTGRRAGPTPGRPGDRGRAHDQEPGRRRQRQHRDARPAITVTVGVRIRGTCPCTIWADAATPAPSRPGHQRGRARGEVPRRRGRLHHRASASTRAPATPARTSGTCGPRPGPCWPTATFTSETAHRLAAGRLRQPGGDHRRTPPTSPPTTRPTATTRPTNDYFASAGVDNRAAARAGRRRRRAQRRLRVRRHRRAFPDRPDSFASANYWVDVVFATRSADDTTPPTVTARTPGRRRRQRRDGSNVTATFSEAMDSTTITSATVELRDPGNALVPATVSYVNVAAPGRHSIRPRLLKYSTTTPRRSRAGRRSQRLGRTTRSPPTELVVHDGRRAATAAGRGTGRTDPRHHQHRQPVQPLLRRDPPRRGPQRVQRHRHLERHARDARRLRRRHPRRDPR